MSGFLTTVTKRKKTPEKLVRLCLQLLTEPAAEGQEEQIDSEKEIQSLCKRLSQMKVILYGSGDKLEVEEDKVNELSASMQSVSSEFCTCTCKRFIYLLLSNSLD